VLGSETGAPDVSASTQEGQVPGASSPPEVAGTTEQPEQPITTGT